MPNCTPFEARILADFRASIGLHSNASDGDEGNAGSLQSLLDIVASTFVSASVAVDGTAAGGGTPRRNQDRVYDASIGDSWNAPSHANQDTGIGGRSDGNVDNRVYEASIGDSWKSTSHANDGNVDDKASLGDAGSLSLARQISELPELTDTNDRKVGVDVYDGMVETGAASVNEAAAIAPPAQLTTEVRAHKLQHCTVDECTKFAQKSGLCCSHYREEHGAFVQKKRRKRHCSVDECTKFIQKSGLCNIHYREEHGVPVYMCSVNECSNAVQKGSLCKKHYREEHGGAPMKRRICSVDECSNAMKKGGLCVKHYREKYGVPASMCSVDECSNQAAVGGMCKKHYSNVYGKPAKKRKVETLT